MAHLTALRVLQARSVVRRDGSPSQGPRDESVRARKAARRVAFHGHRRASPPLDDVPTSPARRLLPGGREKRSYVSPFYESKYYPVSYALDAANGNEIVMPWENRNLTGKVVSLVMSAVKNHLLFQPAADLLPWARLSAPCRRLRAGLSLPAHALTGRGG